MAVTIQDPGVGSWTPINMWAMIKALINNNTPILTINSAQFPIVNGVSGTFVGQAGKGALLIDFAQGILYQNTGSLLSVNWTTVAGTQSFSSNVVASPIQTQAGATPLISSLNRVSVSSAPGNGVALPPSFPGEVIVIDNRSGNSIQVYGNNAAQDTINGIASGTGIPQGANSIVTYYSFVQGNWETSGGLQNSLVQLSANATINPHISLTYVITKQGAALLILPAPTPTTDDGVIIAVTSNTPFVHIISAIGLLNTGTPAVNYLTFSGYAGSTCEFMAFQGRWNVMNQEDVAAS